RLRRRRDHVERLGRPRGRRRAAALGTQQPGRLVAIERVLLVVVAIDVDLGTAGLARRIRRAIFDPERQAGAGLLGARPAATRGRRRRLDRRRQLAGVARRGGVEERDLLLGQLGLPGLLLL